MCAYFILPEAHAGDELHGSIYVSRNGVKRELTAERAFIAASEPQKFCVICGKEADTEAHDECAQNQ